MSQINVNPGRDTRESGANAVVAVLLALVLVVVVVWALAFGGLQQIGIGPAASNAPASQSGMTINIEPKVNVQVPAPSNSAPVDSSTTPPKP
ncbi:MAG: hypothetical protein EPO26_17640 [Chloroflexota bacterium]|nr:MAG: hypothetical protein EPO26_17640 [Chloroflexota bacterium]